MADDNVRLFPRMGAADPPADPPEDPVHEPPAPPEPTTGDALREEPAPRRRSPLEGLAALSEPTAGEPPARADSEPEEDLEQDSAGDGGDIPAMFQSDSWGGQGSAARGPEPGLGALSLAAVLAVSVAALRGVHGALTGTRASREQRTTVADLAASGRGDKNGTGKGRSLIPSSHDFGRRSLGRDRAGNRQGFFGGGGWGGGGRGGRRNTGGGGGFFGGSGGGGRRGGAPGGSRSTGGLFSGGSGRSGGPGGSRGGLVPRKGAGPRSLPGASSSGTGGAARGSTGGAEKSSTGGGRSPRRASQGAGWFRRGAKGKGPAGSGSPSSRGPGSGTGGKAGPKSKGPAPKPGTGAKPGTGGKAGPAPKMSAAKPKGRGPKSPKAGAGPKGTLRSKRPKNGRPGVGAPGGPPPRKRGGKPVTNGSTKLPKGYFHGTIPGWEQGCRCPACTRTWAKANAVVGTRVKGARHGTIAAYEDDECRCKKCVKAAVRRGNARPPEPVTLGRAIGNTFERRWAKRAHQGVKPLVSTQSPKTRRKAAKKKDAARKKGAATAAAAAASGIKVDLKKKPRVDLRKKPGRTTPPGTAPGGTGPGGQRPGSSGPGAAKHRRSANGGHWSRERRRANERAAGPLGPAEDEFWFTLGPDGRMRRTTPWQGVAAATAGPEVVITEQLNKPGGAPAPAVEPVGLPPARPAAPPAPPTAPQAKAGAPFPEQRGAGMSLPAHILPTSLGMHSQHDTEVTIDDVLDELERLTQESFTAHEKSIVIAVKAREVRSQLEELALELRVHHNIIGQLTAAAMERLAESMDLLAAKADEMRVHSLNAAEESEAAQYAMADEYRPVQQATADANLIVPSARIHNEG